MKKLTALFDFPVLSDMNVKAMVLDSRKVTQGDLFVAVKGIVLMRVNLFLKLFLLVQVRSF